MRPIRDIGDVQEGTVLYHSAFGFAEVSQVEHSRVALSWELPGDNLPVRVPHEVLLRVYAVCPRGGFFDRAVRAPDQLREMLQTRPVESLALLLGDLHGPQERSDLKEWLVGRHLLTEEGFRRWWDSLRTQLVEDPRFEVAA